MTDRLTRPVEYPLPDQAVVDFRVDADIFRRLFLNSPDGIIILNDGIILDCNLKACRLLGGTHKAFVGSTISSLVHPTNNHKPDPLSNLQAAILSAEKGYIQHIEMSLWRSDGTFFACDITLKAISSDNPKLIQVTLHPQVSRTTTDLNHPSRPELEDLILSNTVHWVWRTNPEGVLIYSNTRVLPLLGYQVDEVLGKTLFQFIAVEEIERVSHEFSNLYSLHEHLRDFRCVMAAKDGAQITFEINAMPITDTEGAFDGFVGTCHDITNRQETERALAESQERFLLVAEGINDGLWDWDIRYNRMFLSTRWKAMLVDNEKDFNQISDSPDEWFSRIHPLDLDRVKAVIKAHQVGLTSHIEIEHRLMHSNGNYRWFLARGTALRDENHTAIRIAGSLTDLTEHKENQDRLEHDAMHNPLTKLPNRQYFLDQVKRALQRAKRHSNFQAAVLMLDLDHFKIINENLGYKSGDEFLITTAKRLGITTRSGDTIAHFGGDEFGILLEDISGVDQAIRITHRIQEELKKPVILEGIPIEMTASIGIAAPINQYEKPEDVLRDADAALYRAKDDGRARWKVFDTVMNLRTLKDLELEADLRRAVERKEFELYYQPIIRLSDNKITAVEALIRWNNPKRGFILPEEFIKLAEETGLIVPIGEWVLKTACQQINEWNSQGIEIVVAVNVSARQLFSEKPLSTENTYPSRPGKANNSPKLPSFPQVVDTLIRTNQIEGRSLKLEITESAAMADLEMTTLLLNELTRIGVKIAIDDFGTSYSNLEYLSKFKSTINSLKIDKSFIRDIGKNENDQSITDIIIYLGHSLELSVIAEGVETNEQLEFLIAKECDEVQGYICERPLSKDGITTLLKKGFIDPLK